ncbi:hypothetical protein [Peterkaempfera bronchialis]|uniref:hypothetical protein n=1 Tax=Peterkaempfera bronchialis TaxID=2126346 RepID=UPI003C2D5AFD
MAVIAVAGTPGAPGATTSALALLFAWPLAEGRRVLLAECDPDGGAVLAGALEGRIEAVYGLRNLAVADRRGRLTEELWDQLVDLSPGGTADRLLLPGLTDPAQAVGLAYTWEPLIEAFHALEPHGYDVILDLGRSGAYGPSAALVRRADAVLVTVRNTLRGLSAARPRLAALREDLDSSGTGSDALGMLLIQEGPYPAADVSRELGVPVLGLLPYAPGTARVLSDGGESSDRRFVRSGLMRAARSAADEVRVLVGRRRVRLAPQAEGGPQSAAAPGPGTPLAGLAPQPPAPGAFPGSQCPATAPEPFSAPHPGGRPMGTPAPSPGPGAAGPLPGPFAAPVPGVQPPPPGRAFDPFTVPAAAGDQQPFAPRPPSPAAAGQFGAPVPGAQPPGGAFAPFTVAAPAPGGEQQPFAPRPPSPASTGPFAAPVPGVQPPPRGRAFDLGGEQQQFAPRPPFPGPAAPQPAPPAPFPGPVGPATGNDQGEEVLRAR